MRRRNVMKSAVYKCTVILILIMLMIPCFKVDINAMAPMIVLERYEVTDEHIIPGEEFTLTLYFKNQSPDEDAIGVVIDISSPRGIMPVYGKVAQQYVECIAAGDTEKVSIDFIAETSVDSSSVDFSVNVRIGAMTNNYMALRVPSGMDVPFSIISSKIPSEAYVGEIVVSSLTFEILGDENVRNVTHLIKLNGEQLGSSTIGILTPGTTKTQNTSVGFYQPGTYKIDVELQYVDKTDQLQTYVVETQEITVLEKKEEVVPPQQEPIVEEDNTDKIVFLSLSGLFILAILVLVVIIGKKKK